MRIEMYWDDKEELCFVPKDRNERLEPKAKQETTLQTKVRSKEESLSIKCFDSLNMDLRKKTLHTYTFHIQVYFTLYGIKWQES